MATKVRVLGHSVHPILVAFPLGLMATSAVFDAISLATKDERLAETADSVLGAGVVSGPIAAAFGLLDWFEIPQGTRARTVGAWHGIGNVLVMGLFAASWLRRRSAPHKPDPATFTLSVLGLGLAGVTGWLGGELVERLGVSVDEGANVNAPSSLSGQPASEKLMDYQPEHDILGSFVR